MWWVQGEHQMLASLAAERSLLGIILPHPFLLDFLAHQAALAALAHGGMDT